jgi:hypothetical protein
VEERTKHEVENAEFRIRTEENTVSENARRDDTTDLDAFFQKHQIALEVQGAQHQYYYYFCYKCMLFYNR